MCEVVARYNTQTYTHLVGFSEPLDLIGHQHFHIVLHVDLVEGGLHVGTKSQTE